MSSNVYSDRAIVSSITTNDIFEDLIEENARLNKELIFANKCLNVLIGLKDHLMRVLDSHDIAGGVNDYKVLFPADVQKLKKFNSEFKDILKQNTVSCDNCINNERVEKTNVAEECKQEVEDIIDQKVTINNTDNAVVGIDGSSVVKVEDNEEVKANIENINTKLKICNVSLKVKRNSTVPQTGRMTRSTSGKWKVLRHGNQSSPPTESIGQIQVNKKPVIDSHIANDRPIVSNRKVFKTERPMNIVKPFQSVRHKFQNKLSNKLPTKFGTKLACIESDCGFTTSYSSNLRVHKMKHSSEKPYVCKMNGCGKTFKSVYRLHFHCKTVHTSERNYRCEAEGCGKAFKSRMSLKQHSLLHSTLKYVCEYPNCNYKTPFLSNIRNHNSKHSSERNFVCDWPQCNKKFKSRHYLSFHIKKHKQN